MFERILLAVDGSEESRKAVDAAVRLAEATSGDVLVVHVHLKTPGSRATEDLDSRAEAIALTEAVVASVKEAGITVEADLRVARGDHVAKEILDAALSFQADTIVVGSRGLGPFPELFLGSVAHKVVQLARCPVLVVR